MKTSKVGTLMPGHAHPGSRRRMRKGTRSCVECRRRKIRCTYSAGDDVCTHCSKHGKECVDQREQAVTITNTASPNRRQVDTPRADQIIKKRLSEYNLEATGTSSCDLTIHDDLPAGETPCRPPFVSMLTSDEPSHEFHAGQSTEKQANIHSSKTRKEAICKTLRAALPSYDDVTATLAENGGWWDSFRQKTRAISQAEISESLLSFASHAFTSNSPAQVATLVVAYSRSVGNSPQLISLVDNLVISDVSLAATVEGMECLILLGKTYTDIGQPRRAWLTWRKGIATAQLMGLHRVNSGTPAIHQRLWLATYHGDRFTSLLLGLPYGCQDPQVDTPSVNSSNIGEPQNWLPHFVHQTASLAGLVIDRNVSSTQPSIAHSMQLDEQMDNISVLAPEVWWIMPLEEVKSEAEAGEFVDSLLVQFFFFHLRMYIHLPFLNASCESPLATVSRFKCASAARSLLRRYLKLRTMFNGRYLFDCKTTDFVGFTAAVALLVSNSTSRSDGGELDSEDMSILRDVEGVFGNLEKRDNCRIASQCRQALGLLLRPAISQKSPQTISIPYFGKISTGPRREIASMIQSQKAQGDFLATSNYPLDQTVTAPPQDYTLTFWGLQSNDSLGDMAWNVPDDCQDDILELFGPDILDWNFNQAMGSY